MNETPGWTNFAGKTRKFHYIPHDSTMSLCGNWGISPFVADARNRADLQPETGKSVDDCAMCRRKLDKLKKEANAES